MRQLPIFALITILITFLTACGGSSDSDSDSPTPTVQPNTDLETSFANSTVTQCTSNHVKVGSSADFTTFSHDVTGTLTVIDDCTLEITKLNYDGGGPAVFFYGGINSVYTGENSFKLSTLLTGNTLNNNTLRLILPSNKTLDDFDSVAIWCVDLSLNFGDVTF